MSRSRFKLPEVFPAPRLAIAFAFGSAWFFAIPWGGQLFMWLGVGHNLALLALAFVDYRWLLDSRECTVHRDCESTLSIGEQNPIWLEAEHRGHRSLRIITKDEPPIEFTVSPRFVIMDIGPGEVVRINYKVQPLERGDYRFGDLNIRYMTRLGLLMRQKSVPCELAVKVYPDIFQTKKHILLARENRTVQMGLRRSRIRGQGQEFERLRDYMPDDSPRHIDWKATARRNILTTREYDVEQSQTIMILLDIGRTMASRTVEEDGKLGMTKADCAINASVMLAHVAADADDRVGLFCFARGPVTFVPPGKGLPQTTKLLDALYPLQPRVEEPSYYQNFLLLSEKQRKRSLIFLFTDLVDPEASRTLISSIGLLSRKHLVVCIALADYELPALIESQPKRADDLYTQAVALGIIQQRKRALAQLASLGVVTIDATPSDLTIATVNKYLQLKREARL